MEELESGLVLPAGVRLVRPASAPAPWLGGEQMADVATPLFWLDLQRDVRERWGPLLARLYRGVHGRV